MTFLPAFVFVFIILALNAIVIAAQSKIFGDPGSPFDTSICSSLPASVISEIQAYQPIANKIFNAATQSSFKGKTYKKLEYITDTFGPRPSGSHALERSLDYILEQLRKQGLTNPRAETVAVPKITRGRQFGLMLEPRIQKLELVATGFSVSTSILGLIAQIILIPSMEFFMANKMKVLGKIVVIDVKDGSGGMIFSLAEQAGAVALLSRAPVSLSIYSLAQTGGGKLKIPTAIATNEDVDLFGRLTKRGFDIKLKIVIINTVTMTKSRNVMADLPGRLKPNELVLMSGHADSWHFSQGAHDDGVGIVLTLQIPKLFQKLDLIPKRTLRPVIWTAEEVGLFGSTAYVKAHSNELSRYSVVLEADRSCFKPLGFVFARVNTQFGCILNEIMKLQNKSIPTSYLYRRETNDLATDIENFVERGIPGTNFNGNDEVNRYFWYHHTKADTMSIVSSFQLDRCLAFLATATYILADLDDMVPRN